MSVIVITVFERVFVSVFIPFSKDFSALLGTLDGFMRVAVDYYYITLTVYDIQRVCLQHEEAAKPGAYFGVKLILRTQF